MKAVLLSVVLMVVFTGVAYAECPIYTHEWNWDDSTQSYIKAYGDDTAWLTGDDRYVCWDKAEGCHYLSQCHQVAPREQESSLSGPRPEVSSSTCYPVGVELNPDIHIVRVVLDVWCEEAPTPAPDEFVPEPGTLMLLASGIASLAGYGMLWHRIRDRG